MSQADSPAGGMDRNQRCRHRHIYKLHNKQIKPETSAQPTEPPTYPPTDPCPFRREGGKTKPTEKQANKQNNQNERNNARYATQTQNATQRNATQRTYRILSSF